MSYDGIIARGASSKGRGVLACALEGSPSRMHEVLHAIGLVLICRCLSALRWDLSNCNLQVTS